MTLEPLVAQTCIPLLTIVEVTLDHVKQGLYLLEQGREDDAVDEARRVEGLFSLYTMEYNFVEHDWPIEIEDNVKAAIKETLALHHEFMEALADYPD